MGSVLRFVRILCKTCGERKGTPHKAGCNKTGYRYVIVETL